MANWNNPTLTSTYTNFVSEVKDRDVEVALWFEGMSPTNLPTNAKRLNTTSGKFEKWNGTTWVDAVATFTFPALSISGGTANGVLYLDGSKVATSGTALTFDGTNFGVGISTPSALIHARKDQTAATYVMVDNAGAVNANTSAGFACAELGSVSAFFRALRDGSGNVQLYNVANAGLLFGVNNTEQMRLTSTGLGIGTNSPDSKLTLASAATTTTRVLNNIGATTGATYGRWYNTGSDLVWGIESSAGGALLTGSSAYAATLYTNSAVPLQFGTAGTVKATLDSSGNLGLGVTPSAWGSILKPIQLGNAFSYVAGRTDGVRQVWLGSNSYYNGTNWIYGLSSPAAQYYQNDGIHIWNTAPSGTAGNTISFTQAMTLDSSGNLGLGVTPSAWRAADRALQVRSTVVENVNNSASSFGTNYYRDASSVDRYLNTNFAAQYVQNYGDNGSHVWLTAPSGTAGNAISFTQAMTLDASGNLGVGDTSPSTPVGTNRGLVMNGGPNGVQIRLQNTSTGSTSTDGLLVSLDGSNNGYLYNYESAALIFGTNNTERARITSGGDFLVGTDTTSGKLTVRNSGSFTTALVEGSTTAAARPTLSFTRAGTQPGGTGQVGKIGFNSNLNGTQYEAAYIEADCLNTIGIAGIGYIKIGASNSVGGRNSYLLIQDSSSNELCANGDLTLKTKTSEIIFSRIADNSAKFDSSGNLIADATVTGYWRVPRGTTAQRPTGESGIVRFNTSSTQFEGHNGTSWSNLGGGAQAWVNFNGTGTVAIRSSSNVSSITDNGVGSYTVNFTNAMADANYAVLATGGDNATNYQVAQVSSAAAPTTSAVRIQTLIQNSGNPSATDCSRVSVAIFD